MSSPAPTGVAEGQRIAAGAAGVARGAAIVERQRRHAARNRHHFAHVDGQRDDMARIQVTIAAAVDAAARGHNRWRRRCNGVDLQDVPGRVGRRAREVGAIGRPRRCDRRPVQVERTVTARSSVSSSGANRVAEGQRVAAGAAGVGARCRRR